jgi:hypothetical protein
MRGDIPPPVGCHVASLVGKYIFIYGGDDAQLHVYHDIYRLDTGTHAHALPHTHTRTHAHTHTHTHTPC